MRALLIMFFLCFSFFASGENNSAFIYGKVYDHANNEPLIGATIIYGYNQGTISDKNGNYNITIGSGKWKITFQYIGYKSETQTVNLSARDTLMMDVSLYPTLNEIDYIVISANKVEQKQSDLTVSMTLIKPYFLSNNHLTNAEELLNKTPGIEVLDGQASIRGGSGFSYGAGSRVMALIDGLPVISPDAGNIKWQFLPLENLSQVEIIKGASSVLYGSSALNGVINFRTAEAEKHPITKFFAETGIYGNPTRKEWKWWDTPRIFSNASISHLQKFGNTDVGISGSVIYDNGYRKLNDEKLGRLSIHIKHKSIKAEGLYYGINLNSGLTQNIGFVLWENATTGALKQSETTATLLNGSFLAIDPFISYRHNNRTNHDLRMRIQSSSNKYPDGEQTNSNATSCYTEYQFQHHLTKHIFINLGLSENFGNVLSNFYGDHQTLNVAGYSQVDLEPIKRVKIVAGVRLEQNIEDGDPDKLVPIFRTGINYQLSDYSFLRASFGQGYRYPSIAEKYASTSLGAVRIYPNPSILPESGWNSEIGIKQGISFGTINGMLDLAAFYSQNKDMIEYVFGLYQDRVTDVFDFGFQSVNIENSRVYGTELEFSLNQSDSYINQSLHGGYLIMYPVEYNSITKNNTDKFLKYRRMHSASLDWNIRIGKFEMGLNFFAKSKMLAIDNVFINEFTREKILPGFYDYWSKNNKGYLLTDLTFGFRISEQLKLSLAVKNLFNIEYMGRPGDIMPQRNISIRLSGIY
jgi:outer membrane cobalamin receptor